MTAETVDVRFGTGEQDTLPARVYCSRGVHYVVTRSWAFPGLFAITQRAHGYAAADGLSRRQAEILAAIYDRILPAEPLQKSRLVVTNWPPRLRVWASAAQYGFHPEAFAAAEAGQR